MAKFYTPEQWAELSDEDKLAFFGMKPQKLAGGGFGSRREEMPAVDPSLIVEPPHPTAAGPSAPAAYDPFALNVTPTAAAAPGPAQPALGSAGQAENAAAEARTAPLNLTSSSSPLMASTTRTSVSGTRADIAPEMAAIKEAGASRLKALEGAAKFEQEAADREAATRNKLVEDAQEAEIKRVEAEAKRGMALRASEDDIKAAMEESKAMRVDPNKFYADRGTLGTIVAALAMGAGAYGAAMTGTKNFAAEIIENAIDRDIQAQKENIANKKSDIGHKVNLYNLMQARFNDDRQSEAATRIAMRQNVLDTIEAARADALAKGKPFAQEGLRAEIIAKNAAESANLKLSTAEKYTSETVTAPVAGGKERLAPAKWFDVAKDLQKSRRQVEGYDKILEWAGKDAKNVGRIESAYNETLKRLVNKSDPNYEKLKMQRNIALFEMASGISGAAYSEKELQRFEEIIPNLWSDPAKFKAQMEVLREHSAQRHADELELAASMAPAGSQAEVERLRIKPTQSQLQQKKTK